ncbi:MAG: amino acid ABC transporter permease [Candidatus Hydrogenedentes bacterium]|nr:amino acid ABC transporter permease [Candidatus Hydrogenedentota bacterium]
MKALFWSRQSTPPPRAMALNFLLALLVLSVIFYVVFGTVAYEWRWDGVWDYRAKFLQGWVLTVAISAAALVMSLGIGMLAAAMHRAPFLPLRAMARVYVELIRSTPLLVQILIFFYIVGNAFGVTNRYVAGVLILSLFSAAYISEIFRAGIESVGETQWETGRALGLTTPQMYRFVVIPQMFRQVLPPLTGQLVSLVKDSSLLSVIAISEFTLNAQEVNSATYSTLESYLPLAVGYLIITLPLSLLTRYMEGRLAYGN